MSPRRFAVLLPVAGVLLGAALLGGLELGLRLLGFTPKQPIRHFIHRFPDEQGSVRDSATLLEAGDARELVLCLGDSFTYGMGVPHDATYPAQLQLRLGGSRRVVNLGELGSGPERQRRRLHEALRHRPSLVVLGALINDAADAEREVSRPPGSPRTAVGSLVDAGTRWLLFNTASYPFAFSWFQRLRGIPYPFERKDTPAEDFRRQKLLHYAATADGSAWEDLVFPRWREMFEESRAAGAAFLLVLFPVDMELPGSGAATPRLLELQGRIRAFAASAGVPLCDPSPALADALSSGRYRLGYTLRETTDLAGRLFERAPPALYLHDGHPSPFAYAIAADAIAGCLRSIPGWEGGVPPEPPGATTR